MPKLKSNRSAAKRFARTGTGKFKRAQGYANHILTKKSPKRKRQLRKGLLVHAADTASVRRMLPYS